MGLVFLFPRRALFGICSLAQRKEKLRPENQLHLHVSTGLGGSPLFLKPRIGRLTSEASAQPLPRGSLPGPECRQVPPAHSLPSATPIAFSLGLPGCSEMGLQCFLSKKTHLSLVK